MGKTGIIIVNTGSPAAPTSEAVAEYLRAFLSDPRICPMNPRLWRLILNRFIIPKRAPVSAAKYATIWTDEGAPLDAGMRSLAQKLERACAHDDDIALVRHAMCYSAPFVEDALADCREHDCNEVTVIPLYPQSAFSTTMAVKDKVNQAIEDLDWTPALRFVESYHDEPAYIAAIADSVSQSGFDADAGDRLLFAFHSIPMTDIRAGDTYDEQTRQTARNVADALGLPENAWRVGYQCRFDKSRTWLGPFTKEVLGTFADARRLFVIAPNFSVDCLETTHDIQDALRGAWFEADAGRTEDSFVYVPCLNDSPAQIDLIRQVVLRALSTPCVPA